MVKKTKKSQKGKKSKKELEGHHQPIEPLHGIARQPFAKVCCATEGHPHDTDIYDITYLVVHSDCGKQQRDGAPKPRTLLFDLGASVGFKGVPGSVYAEMPTEGGGARSLSAALLAHVRGPLPRAGRGVRVGTEPGVQNNHHHRRRWEAKLVGRAACVPSG
mmetsp:Transcript_67170/g.125533  ORF Transcript_67170/g.125533 Transcript_67170/m.125533 type:complete len:161 (+) Transcript_67170:524-1006(+)